LENRLNKVQKELSVIIPLFNEEKSLGSLYGELKSALKSFGKSYEIIFVDDGSKDNSWSVLERLHAADKDIRGIHSYNYLPLSMFKSSGKGSRLTRIFSKLDASYIFICGMESFQD